MCKNLLSWLFHQASCENLEPSGDLPAELRGSEAVPTAAAAAPTAAAGTAAGRPGGAGYALSSGCGHPCRLGTGRGAQGRSGVRARPGQRTQRGRHDLRKSWGAGAGPFSLWQRLSGTGLRVRSPTGRRARPWPAGRPGPRSARSLSPPPTPPTPACLPWPPPPRDPLPVGALLK